jgi:hypothetical protein
MLDISIPYCSALTLMVVVCSFWVRLRRGGRKNT